MKLDRNAVNHLLSLDDAALAATIRKMATDAGIDPGVLPLGASNLAAIRYALSMASDDDLARAAEQISGLGKKGKEKS